MIVRLILVLLLVGVCGDQPANDGDCWSARRHERLGWPIVNASETRAARAVGVSAAVVWTDSLQRSMMRIPFAKEVSMQRIGDMFAHRSRDDFAEGDHQEYVESGVRDVLLIGGAAALLIGGFVISLI
jgi:hypothetical protein